MVIDIIFAVENCISDSHIKMGNHSKTRDNSLQMPSKGYYFFQEPTCRSEEIRCESRGGNKKTLCRITGQGRITKLQLLEGFPRSKCLQNTNRRRGTYGFKGKHVWVKNNCVGEFRVCLGEGN